MSEETHRTVDTRTEHRPGGTGSGEPNGARGAERSRTITWHELERHAQAEAVAMSGLELLTAMKEDRLPASPIARLAGIEAVRIEPGDVVFESVADPSFDNPIGNTHGGFLCTLLDSAAASAVHTTLPAGVGYTSVEIKVSFLRAVRAGDRLLVHGWVTKPGRKVVFAEADIRGADGKLLATASTTCLILRG